MSRGVYGWIKWVCEVPIRQALRGNRFEERPPKAGKLCFRFEAGAARLEDRPPKAGKLRYNDRWELVLFYSVAQSSTFNLLIRPNSLIL